MGATPKLTKSARESNCFPNSDCALSFLARNPSKKSKMADKRINNDATYRNSGFLSEIKIEIVPLKILRAVIVFGIIILFIEYIFSIGHFCNPKFCVALNSKILI